METSCECIEQQNINKSVFTIIKLRNVALLAILIRHSFYYFDLLLHASHVTYFLLLTSHYVLLLDLTDTSNCAREC